jgi:hypothetical protein
VAHHCPNPPSCFRCREPGHEAHECTRPCLLPRVAYGRTLPHRCGSGWLQSGGHPSRDPSTVAVRANVLLSSLGRTPSATFRSTPCSLSPPDICAPPLDPSSSPTPEVLEPPDWWAFLAGAPQRRPPAAVCIINRSEEISCKEQALDLALLAVVGGSRPLVSVA